MNNQYSRGCSYNYRRSPQRDISMERRSEDSSSMEKSLAMGYVPMQRWSRPLPPDKGLQIGTIFADLFKPFCGKGGVCR